MLLLFVCNFKCIVVNMSELTIEISSKMMNSIMGQMFVTKFGLLIMSCLLIDKPSIKWIVVPLTMLQFAMYGTMWSFCSLFVLIKCFWMALIICGLLVHGAPPTCCNIWLMEFICVNVSNAKICNLFILYFSFMKKLKDLGEI